MMSNKRNIVKIIGEVTIKQNDKVIAKIKNEIKLKTLAYVIYLLLTNNIPNSNSGSPSIVVNNQYLVTATQSISSESPFQISWSGSYTFNTNVTVTSLALNPIFYEGSNGYQITVSEVNNLNIQLNPGTYTFEWTWTVIDSTTVIVNLFANTFTKNLQSVSITYLVNGQSASGFVFQIANVVSFCVYTQNNTNSQMSVTEFGFTVTYNLPNNQTATVNVKVGITSVEIPPSFYFVDFVNLFLNY